VSLRTRVLAGLILIALVLGAVLVALTRATEENLISQIDDQLDRAEGPVQIYERDKPPGSPGDDPTHLSSLYVGYLDDGGELAMLAEPNLRGEDPPLPAIDPDEALDALQNSQAFTVRSEGGELRYRARVYVDERTDRVVVLALPIDTVDDSVSDLISVAIIGGVAILIVLGLVAWWVIHLGVRPIKRMTSVATSIAGGDLSPRVPDADPRTEAGELGLALNTMMGNIEDAFDERTRAEENLRQFVADASHELRTPVATIRGYAELYRSGALADGDELDDAMRRTEQEAIRMGTLVDDLLHLARLDQGRPLEAEPVDLVALAQDAARDARAVDPARPIAAVTDGALVVRGDESRLRQVIANVVGNALVHTPSGSAVDIRTAREGDRAVLSIIDHGPGMSDEVVARAFERFYRADPARSRHRGGSGLGLAIVDATVAAHGGTAVLESEVGVGTTVRIELPLETG
jgi:two-component system, OmpR family, sensor kinase